MNASGSRWPVPLQAVSAAPTLLLRAILLAIASAFALLPAAAGQSPWPAKPVRLVVPFSPGAGTDTIARLIAQKLGEALGASIVVDNRSGAGGAIGAAEVARAEPDGYTLLFVASPFTTVAAASKKAGYDPVGQFAAVAPIAAGPLAFVVGGTVPANTMQEFIALARANPGKLNYGSAGTGSINHLALELLKVRAGVDIVHVPYRGIADATKDLLSGQIQAMTASIPAMASYAGDRRLKVLAITGPSRVDLLPDVPSWQEAGVTEATVVNYWGIVAPAGTPRDVVARLNAEINSLLRQPEVKARLAREGAELIPGSPEQFASLIERDLRAWKKLIADAKLTLD